MNKQEYKRKLKCLEWFMNIAELHQTELYDEEIELLANEIEAYELKYFPILKP